MPDAQAATLNFVALPTVIHIAVAASPPTPSCAWAEHRGGVMRSFHLWPRKAGSHELDGKP